MFNGYCYKYFETQKTWSDAKTYCQNLGSYLVTAHSQAENDFASSLLPAGVTQAWMGGNDIASNGVWVWEDGKPWGVYTAWNPGEPNNSGGIEHCAQFYVKGGLWNDRGCSTSLPFVCKK